MRKLCQIEKSSKQGGTEKPVSSLGLRWQEDHTICRFQIKARTETRGGRDLS